jgi:hypothetical protein
MAGPELFVITEFDCNMQPGKSLRMTAPRDPNPTSNGFEFRLTKTKIRLVGVRQRRMRSTKLIIVDVGTATKFEMTNLEMT